MLIYYLKKCLSSGENGNELLDQIEAIVKEKALVLHEGDILFTQFEKHRIEKHTVEQYKRLIDLDEEKFYVNLSTFGKDKLDSLEKDWEEVNYAEKNRRFAM